jgi:hypothetical protein
MQQTPRISPRNVMVLAWALARMGAKAHGGKPSLYFREALRQAWRQVKADHARMLAVLAKFERLAEVPTPSREPRRVPAGYTTSTGYRTGRHQGGRW